jgi:hypothetical protein
VKKALEQNIIKSLEDDKIEATCIPISMSVKFNINNNRKTKNLAEKEKRHLIYSKTRRIKENKRLKLDDISINDINKTQAFNDLLDYYLKHNAKNKTNILIMLYSNMILEDENKKLTLTDKQYKSWLESNAKQYITTSQCEILFGLSKKQQQSLRSKIRDSLEYIQLDKKSILYDRVVIEKYLENYISRAR